MNRSVIIFISTLVLGYVFKTNANESFLNLEDGEIDQHLMERAATSSSLSDSEIKTFLDKHNELRSITVPTASNMQYMVWDSSLATMAQQWSDGCYYDHGNPSNISPFSSVGQNLHAALGSQSNRVNGVNVVQSWFDEKDDYTYATDACQAGKMCGHYTQVAWAKSTAVGCGMTFCPTTTGLINWANTWYVTCNYGPAGNGDGAPFLQGTPCTQCESGIGQCYNNQCRLCSTHSEACECKQVCLNGGTLDAGKCSCNCADGFYGSDCSKVCEDTDAYCGGNPGWPISWCDAEHSYVLTSCPKFCGLCVAASATEM